MRNFRKSSGFTLMTLVVTIAVMLILAAVSVNMITGDEGIIDEAKEATNNMEIADLKEQITIAILQTEAKVNSPQIADVTQKLIENGIIKDASQVDLTTGAITVNKHVIEGMLDDYIDSKRYYGDVSIIPTNQKYFTFSINEDGKTATITGVKEEYSEKYFYADITIGDVPFVAAIKDNGAYITEVVIPYKVYVGETEYIVNTIGEMAFMTKYHENVTAQEANAYFESFILPNTIINIEDKAFYGCKELSNIEIQNGINNIGDSAFGSCISLKNISLPDTIVSMGNSVFTDCASLSSISIPPKVTRIGNNAFCRCTSLKNVNMSENILDLGQQAFFRCTSLSNINIPNKVTSIGREGFSECTSLNSINIPKSVTNMEYSIFTGWTANQTINCEASSAPASWDNNWDNSCSAKVNWGVSM